MKAETVELSKLIELNTVFWDKMNAAGIATSDTSMNRDNLTHIRHWSEIVTHKAVQQRF